MHRLNLKEEASCRLLCNGDRDRARAWQQDRWTRQLNPLRREFMSQHRCLTESQPRVNSKKEWLNRMWMGNETKRASAAVQGREAEEMQRLIDAARLSFASGVVLPSWAYCSCFFSRAAVCAFERNRSLALSDDRTNGPDVHEAHRLRLPLPQRKCLGRHELSDLHVTRGRTQGWTERQHVHEMGTQVAERGPRIADECRSTPGQAAD